MLVALSPETWGWVVIAAVVALAVAWFVVAHARSGSGVSGHAAHFLDTEAQLPPEEEIKQRHTGAGGFG